MKILVICQYYFPEQFKITDVCEELVLRGHSVTVLTGLPNYPTGIIPDEYKGGKKRSEIINGVKVTRCFETARKKGTLALLMNYISFMVSSCFKVLFIDMDYDIVFVYQLSPITMAFSSLIVKRMKKVPVYLYCCDLWPESALNILNNASSIVFKFIKSLSTYIYSRCDYISVTSRPFIRYFIEKHGIREEKLNYIPQFAEDEYLKKDFGKEANETVEIYYIGNIGIVQKPEAIIEATRLARGSSNFRLHFIGTGSAESKCKNLVAEYQLDDIVQFHGYQNIETIPSFLKKADICILALSHRNEVGLTLPLRLLSYMAAGKPVIASIDGSAAEIINEANCGICVRSGDIEGLSKAIAALTQKKDELRAIGLNGRKFYEKNFTKAIHVNSIERIMLVLANKDCMRRL